MYRMQFGDGYTSKFVHNILVYIWAKIGALIKKKCSKDFNIFGITPHFWSRNLWRDIALSYFS